MRTAAVRLIEQAVVGALGGFLAAWGASGYDLSRGALGAAAGAGLRALYGIVTLRLGDDKETPSIK